MTNPKRFGDVSYSDDVIDDEDIQSIVFNYFTLPVFNAGKYINVGSMISLNIENGIVYNMLFSDDPLIEDIVVNVGIEHSFDIEAIVCDLIKIMQKKKH